MKNKIGFYTEKVQLGEQLKKTCKRCLFRETGLVAKNYELVGVSRILRKSKKKNILADVVLHYFVASNLAGELKKETKVSQNDFILFKDLYESKLTPYAFNHEINLIKRYFLEGNQFVTERSLGEIW